MGGSFARTNLPDPVSSATYDLANQILSFDGFTPTYDLNGNLTSLDGDTYNWDVRNRLAALTGPGLSASFQYDALGRRSKKILNGQPTEFMSDEVNPLQEQAVAGGNWTALTMTGLGVDEIIARGDFSGVYYYLPDGTGSTLALTDETGAIHTDYTYTPFGETTRTGTVSTNPFQFTGRENDNTGLYYYRARYYHPVLQRFISEDPIGFAGGDINLYGYVLNSPLNFIDPRGLDVYVAFYPGGSGFGHVGVGVNTPLTTGFYAQNAGLAGLRDALNGVEVLLGQNDLGVVTRDIDHLPDALVKIPTSAEQDQMVQAYINKVAHEGPNNYNLYNRSCVAFVRMALQAAGIETSNVLRPAELLEDLKRRELISK